MAHLAAPASGNHEEKHLNQRKSADGKLSPDHLRTRRALSDEHYAYFERLPLFIELPEIDTAPYDRPTNQTPTKKLPNEEARAGA